MDKITSAKNPTIRALKALSTRKGREAAGRFLVEGEVMLREALKCGLKIHELLADEADAALAEEFEGCGARASIVPPSTCPNPCRWTPPRRASWRWTACRTPGTWAPSGAPLTPRA